MIENNTKINLKQLISRYLLIYFMIAIILSFFMIFVIDFIYENHIPKINLFESLGIELDQYTTISDQYLIENDAGMEIIDVNLKVIASKGIAESPGYQYSENSFAKLIENEQFTERVSCKSLNNSQGNQYTIVLKQYFTQKTAKKLSKLSHLYAYSLFIATMIVFLIIFAMFVRKFYRKLKENFDLIEKNISKTPYDKTKVDLSKVSLDESQAVLLSYNRMLDEMEFMKQEKDAALLQSQQLISNLSHDLKSPITTLKGYSELLLDSNLNNTQIQDYLRYINQSALDLSELIKLLFEQVKFQHTDFSLNLEFKDINGFLRDLCANYYIIFDKRCFQINIEIEETPYFMKFDPINMKRAFCNLFENCLNHNPIPTQIEIASYHKDGLYFILFKDNGVGISDENATKIFDPFFQGDQSRSKNHGGLGLYVTNQIIQKHGGKIRFLREKAYKTVFEISFKEL